MVADDAARTIAPPVNDEVDHLSSDPELPTPTDLVDVVADLKVAFLVPPDELTTRRHLAGLAAFRANQQSARSRRTRRRRRILVPLGVTGGLILATSGLAAANVLPAPMQNAVAAVEAPFGIELPTTDTPDDGPSRSNDDRDRGTDSTPAGPTTSESPRVDGSSPNPPAAPSQGAAGQAGTNPGHSDQAPGHTGTNPGNSDQAPGHTGTNPGHSDQAPGHTGTNPGHSDQAPGHTGTNPGHSDQAPGHTGTNPGKSEPR